MPIRVYLFEKKPDCRVESRELLMRALSGYCEDCGLAFGRENTKIEAGEHGKPVAMRKQGNAWEKRKDLHFSVSHTKNWWLCAVYHKPVGVDIEERGRVISSAAAERVFTPEEQEWLARVGVTPDHMLELWVRKEAYVKYLGTGISEGLKTFSVVRCGELAEYVGEKEKKAFCGAVCPEGLRGAEECAVPLVGAFCTEDEPSGLKLEYIACGDTQNAEHRK